jgi:carbon storage regulator
MLILTRKIGQRLMVGDDVIIEVVDINKSEIRLGITAPEHIKILREELYWQVRETKEV